MHDDDHDDHGLPRMMEVKTYPAHWKWVSDTQHCAHGNLIVVRKELAQESDNTAHVRFTLSSGRQEDAAQNLHQPFVWRAKKVESIHCLKVTLHYPVQSPRCGIVLMCFFEHFVASPNLVFVNWIQAHFKMKVNGVQICFFKSNSQPNLHRYHRCYHASGPNG